LVYNYRLFAAILKLDVLFYFFEVFKFGTIKLFPDYNKCKKKGCPFSTPFFFNELRVYSTMIFLLWVILSLEIRRK